MFPPESFGHFPGSPQEPEQPGDPVQPVAPLERELHARPEPTAEPAAEPAAAGRSIAHLLRRVRTPFIQASSGGSEGESAPDPEPAPEGAEPNAEVPESETAPPAAGGDDGGEEPPSPPRTGRDMPDPDRPLPSHFIFHGPARVTAVTRRMIARRDIHPEAPVEGEAQPLSQEREDYRALTERVTALAAQPGVDVDISDRLPIPAHVFSNGEAFELEAASRGYPQDTVSFTTYDKGAIIRRADDSAETARRLAHGMGWTVGATHFVPDRDRLLNHVAGVDPHQGLDVLSAGRTGNTFVSGGFGQLLTNRLMAGTQHGPMTHRHPDATMIFDGVIRAAAARTGVTPGDIENTLLRGHLSGSMEDTRILHTALGRGVMRRVSSLPSPDVQPYAPRDAIRILSELGLKDQSVEIAREWVTGNYQHFNWRNT